MLQTSNYSLLLIYLPRKDERLSRPGWLTYSGWFTHISGHPSAAGRAQDRVSSPVKDQRSTTVPRNQPKCDTVCAVGRAFSFQLVSVLWMECSVSLLSLLQVVTVYKQYSTFHKILTVNLCLDSVRQYMWCLAVQLCVSLCITIRSPCDETWTGCWGVEIQLSVMDFDIRYSNL